MEKHQLIVNDQEWKQILNNVHFENIPIELNTEKLRLKEFYGNHVPKQLYIKHSYGKLKNSISAYMRQFEKICLKNLQNNQKKYKALLQNGQTIRLGLYQITQELGFLNIKPISQIVSLLNSLIFNNEKNFIDFVKTTKGSRLSDAQRTKQLRNVFTNLCSDCKQNRQEILIKDLKRKISMKKLDINLNHSQKQNGIEKKASKIQVNSLGQNILGLNQTIGHFIGKKQEIEENFYEQNRSQSLSQKNMELTRNQYFNKEDRLINEDDNLSEKESYIQELSSFVANREFHQASTMQRYSHLLRQLMQFPYLNQLSQQQYLKQTEDLIEGIQNQLFQNFLSTLNGPFRQAVRKVNCRKSQKDRQVIDIKRDKVTKRNAEAQTIPMCFQTKSKQLQKELQRKTFQIASIKHNKDQLQKKYFSKYQQQLQNQRQLNQRYGTIRQLERKVKDVLQEKEILREEVERERSVKIQTVKRMQLQNEKAISAIKTMSDKKYQEYRQKINDETSIRIRKISQEKNQQINQFKSLCEMKLKNQSEINNQFNTLKNFDLESSHFQNPDVSRQEGRKESLGTRGFISESKKPSYNSPLNTKFPQNSSSKKEANQYQLMPDHQINQRRQSNIKRKNKQNQGNQPKKLNSKDQSIKSIDLMIKYHQISNQQPQIKLKGSVQRQSKSRLYRKTTKQLTSPGQQRDNREYIVMKTQKSSPNKVSSRRFRKTQKQFQLTFKPKLNTYGQSTLSIGKQEQCEKIKENFVNHETENHDTEVSQTNKQDICLIPESKHDNHDEIAKVNNYDKKQQKLILNRQKVKNIQLQQSTIKLKNNYLEKEDQATNISTTKDSGVTRGTLVSGNKSAIVLNKSLNKNSTSWNNSLCKLQTHNFFTNSLAKQSSLSKSKDRIQKDLIQRKSQQNYTIEQTKQMLEADFEYFKKAGLIEKVYSLRENQRQRVRNKILTVAKTILSSKFTVKNNSKTKTKNLNTTSHQFLKQIVQKSMSKLYSRQNVAAEDSPMNQTEQLSQLLFNEIDSVKVFSQIQQSDLELFGGKSMAHQMELHNHCQAQSPLTVMNNFNFPDGIHVFNYFKQLYTLNQQKYKEYVHFLKHPVSYFNETIKEVNKNKMAVDQNQQKKKHQNQQIQPQRGFEQDGEFLKAIINKILSFHQRIHERKCLHLQKFLKKIGFFKYSSSQQLLSK